MTGEEQPKSAEDMLAYVARHADSIMVREAGQNVPISAVPVARALWWVEMWIRERRFPHRSLLRENKLRESNGNADPA